MQEEKRPLDPTRRLLRVFGVKVTDYEERAARLLEEISATSGDRPDELLRLANEAIDLSADMNARLREMTAHVLDAQTRVLSEIKAALEKKAP
jgi:hypothetical protein